MVTSGPSPRLPKSPSPPGRNSWTVFPLTANHIWNIAASSSPVKPAAASCRTSSLQRINSAEMPRETRRVSVNVRSANAASSWIFFPKGVTLHLPPTIKGGRGARLLLLNDCDSFQFPSFTCARCAAATFLLPPDATSRVNQSRSQK